jgi:hypothetical protein
MGGEQKADRVCMVTDKNGKIKMPPMMAWLSMPPRILLFNFNKQLNFFCWKFLKKILEDGLKLF